MTPDQLFIIKRMLQLTPAQIDELRANMKLFDDAVDKLNGTLGRSTRTDALSTIAALEAHQKEIINPSCLSSHATSGMSA